MIDFLYIKNCAEKEKAMENLVNALTDLGFSEKDYYINEREIKTEKEAKLWRLAGSPTIRINGTDICQEKLDYGLFKRLYGDKEGATPSISRIKEAIRMDMRERVQSK